VSAITTYLPEGSTLADKHGCGRDDCGIKRDPETERLYYAKLVCGHGIWPCGACSHPVHPSGSCPGPEERRTATEDEQAECRELGCGPDSWRAGCPLHGFPAALDAFEKLPEALERVVKQLDGIDHPFWNERRKRAEAAVDLLAGRPTGYEVSAQRLITEMECFIKEHTPYGATRMHDDREDLLKRAKLWPKEPDWDEAVTS
jgi:hypothetical protein